MSNSNKNAADDGGWGEESSADHTTVDPNLLDRLAALDAQDEAPMGAPPAGGKGSNYPPEHTVTLGMDDLLNVNNNASAAPRPEPRRDAGMGHGASPPVDVNGEKTQVFVPAMEDEPSRAKLKVLQGGGQQKEYMLARDRVTMGRGTNNDILVPDIAISRQHLEIIRKPDGTYKMRDMNSGNGTKLNGSRVIESDLFVGDRIEIGSTIFEFVLTGPGAGQPSGERHIVIHPSEKKPNPSRSGGYAPVPSPAPAPPTAAPAIPNYHTAGGGQATITHYPVAPPVQPAATSARSSNLLLTVLILCFGLLFMALVLVVGAKLYLNQQDNNTVAAASEEDDVKGASDFYLEGVALAQEKKWDEAEENLNIAMELGTEEREFQVRKDAERQLKVINQEKEFAKELKRGKQFIEDDELVDAIDSLESIRSHSVYYSEARNLVEKTKKTYANTVVTEARAAFDDKRYDEADEKVSALLGVVPNHKAAKTLRAEILKLPPEVHTPRPIVAENTQTRGKWRERFKDKDKTKTNTKADNADKASTKDNTGLTAAANTKGTGKGKSKGTGKGKDKGSAPDAVNFTPGLTMYRSKQFGEAAAFFDKISAEEEGFYGQKASTLARSIRSFEQSFKKGVSAYQSNNYPQATRYLTNAARLDKAISGSGGYFQAQLRDMLAESHFKQAEAAFQTQNFARAGSHAKKAKSYKPAHPGVQTLLSQLEVKAKSMYIDAINKKTSDPKQAKRIT
ncbi:MAG: FHA domain-containing protein, partial [Myxococcota bacterium]